MASRAWRFAVLLLVVGQVLVAAGSAPAVEGTTPTGGGVARIHVRDERLTVKLQGVSLEAVLKEIARQAGIEISVPGVPMQTVSVEFRDLPLEDGLQRLLRGYGWVMSYAAAAPPAGTTLAKVIVLSGGEGAPSGQRGGAPEPKREETLARAVAAMLGREEIKTRLRMYPSVSTAKDRWNALQGLLRAVDLDGVPVLVEMLQDENVRSTDWAIALAPLFGVIPLSEQQFMLRALRDPTVKERLVKTLELYALAETRLHGHGR